MRFVLGLENATPLPGCVVTAGAFDGVHLGHQQLLRRIISKARQDGVPSVVITYWPHPRLVLHPEQTDLKLLTTLEEKRALLEQIGVDMMLVITFTREFSQWTYQEYLQRVLKDGLKAGMFVLGHDHHFGQNREGSIEKLIQVAPEYGFQVEEIPAHLINENAVSSSKIRAALAQGDCQTAREFLGRPYSFCGTVVKGMQLGRTLGYPTLNLSIDDPHKLLPAGGVYAVRVEIEGQVHGGMMNIGMNPTIEGKGWSCEVHVFDFEGDVYGRTATVLLERRLRDELKFDGLEPLKARIAQDEVESRAILFSEE